MQQAPPDVHPPLTQCFEATPIISPCQFLIAYPPSLSGRQEGGGYEQGYTCQGAGPRNSGCLQRFLLMHAHDRQLSGHHHRAYRAVGHRTCRHSPHLLMHGPPPRHHHQQRSVRQARLQRPPWNPSPPRPRPRQSQSQQSVSPLRERHRPGSGSQHRHPLLHQPRRNAPPARQRQRRRENAALATHQQPQGSNGRQPHTQKSTTDQAPRPPRPTPRNPSSQRPWLRRSRGSRRLTPRQQHPPSQTQTHTQIQQRRRLSSPLMRSPLAQQRCRAGQ